MSNDVAMRLAEAGDLVPLLIILGSLLTAIVVVGLLCLRTVLVARARETTRREVAAYVAEGTMSAEDAASLLHGSPGHVADEVARVARSAGDAASKLNDLDFKKIAEKVKAGGVFVSVR